MAIGADTLGRPDGEARFPLLVSNHNDTLAVQLDDTNGDGKWDELFFVINLEPRQKRMLTFRWIADSLAFEQRTSVRHGVRTALDDTVQRARSGTFLPRQLPLVTGYQPFQTDGPSWENDLVGFRHYLDGRNSKDVFGKRVAYMSPQNVGINERGVTEDNYHTMEDWGRDILSVGNSLGIGGVSLLIGEDNLYRMGSIEGDTLGPVDRTDFKVYSEGPVRSILDFQYHHWRLPVIGRVYSAQEIVEIWPGFHGYKNTISFSGLQGDEHAVIGLVNSRTDQELNEVYIDDQWIVLATHDQQTYEKEWWLGLALVLPRLTYEGYMKAPDVGRIATTYLAKLRLEESKPVSYYALACWELRDPGFRDTHYFEEYLRDFVRRLSNNVTIAIHYDN